MAWTSWQRCYKKMAKKIRLKGRRNRLNSIPLSDPIKYPTNNRIKLPKIGIVKYHKQQIPKGKIKCGRIVKRASGWYLCLLVDAMPKVIQAKKNRLIGIDPVCEKNLATTEDDLDIIVREIKKKRFEEKKKSKPEEHKKNNKTPFKDRLAQAQRANDKKLCSRLMERLKNRRKEDNHKLSRKLVEECKFIAFSKDSIQKIARKSEPQKRKMGNTHERIKRILFAIGIYSFRGAVSRCGLVNSYPEAFILWLEIRLLPE